MDNDQMKIREQIGIRLKKAREDAGLTQLELAKKLDISVNYVSMIERGEVNFSFDKIYMLIKALKIKSSNVFSF
jgi:transcriptional regulator with XRE-family HTH domain